MMQIAREGTFQRVEAYGPEKEHLHFLQLDLQENN